MKSALGSIVMVAFTLVCLYGWNCFRTFQIKNKMDNFDNCANCMALAMAGDTDFLLSMCKDLAINEYTSFLEDNQRFFSDGVLGANGIMNYEQGLGLLTVAFAFIVLGISFFVKDEDPRNTLSPKLFMFGFIWTLLCLAYILDLSAANEESFPEMGTCWVLSVSLAKKEMNASVTKWIWASLAVFAGVVLGCSALACRCDPQKNLSTFFVTAGLCIAIPGVFGLGYLLTIVCEINTVEVWVLFAKNVIMLGATVFWTARIRNNETARASDVGVRVGMNGSYV